MSEKQPQNPIDYLLDLVQHDLFPVDDAGATTMARRWLADPAGVREWKGYALVGTTLLACRELILRADRAERRAEATEQAIALLRTEVQELTAAMATTLEALGGNLPPEPDDVTISSTKPVLELVTGDGEPKPTRPVRRRPAKPTEEG